MNVIDFIANEHLDLTSIDIHQSNLILTSPETLEPLLHHYQIPAKDLMHRQDDFPVLFKAGAGYDFFSFVYFRKGHKNIDFKKMSLLLMKNNLIVMLDDKKFYDAVLEELHHENESDVDDVLSHYFYLLDTVFSEMFVQLSLIEEHMNQAEIQLITDSKEYRIKEVISEKNNCLKIKKYVRLLVYAAEDLNLNLNELIPEDTLRLFQNITNKINLINEMSNQLYEMSAHLLEVYDSAISTKTNNSINKLTVFNFFAMPITMLSGIYGMNFINMPELNHPYGYYIVLGIMVVSLFVIYRMLKKMKLL